MVLHFPRQFWAVVTHSEGWLYFWDCGTLAFREFSVPDAVENLMPAFLANFRQGGFLVSQGCLSK